jgi:hypothetical protein
MVQSAQPFVVAGSFGLVSIHQDFVRYRCSESGRLGEDDSKNSGWNGITRTRDALAREFPTMLRHSHHPAVKQHNPTNMSMQHPAPGSLMAGGCLRNNSSTPQRFLPLIANMALPSRFVPSKLWSPQAGMGSMPWTKLSISESSLVCLMTVGLQTVRVVCRCHFLGLTGPPDAGSGVGWLWFLLLLKYWVGANRGVHKSAARFVPSTLHRIRFLQRFPSCQLPEISRTSRPTRLTERSASEIALSARAGVTLPGKGTQSLTSQQIFHRLVP